MLEQNRSTLGADLSPPDVLCCRLVDLQTEAVRLCIALQSDLNSVFLYAAGELLTCGRLSSADFHRHSRKIIRLIETARDRLETSGISLYLFTSCHKPKYKDIYFDLLRMLQARRRDVDVTLEARTNTLLFRLSSNFGGHNSAGARISTTLSQLPENLRQSLDVGVTTCTPSLTPQPPKSAATYSSMPPPDGFPPNATQSFVHRKRPRTALHPGPLWVPQVTRRKRTRFSTEQENDIPTPEPAPYAYKAPRLTKRFGIFCTGNNSMHRRGGQPVHAY
ncbi:hypothetical protein B0H10DRAFT_2118901 [Mycena sp. CBHHK59/15]|nr:hypothetical protein B0H10DRAFT_2118901 [Mycena sp. CBHHK59/15]